MKYISSLLFFLTILGVTSQNLSLETDFGSGGIKKISTDGSELDLIRHIDLNDNSFLLYSKIYDNDTSKANVIYKINTDGTFDSSFGVNGKLTLPNYFGSFFVYQQNPDKLIVFFTRTLSSFSTEGERERVIMRYDANGNLDSTFGQNGEIKIAIGDSDGSGQSNILVQNDNRILFSDSEKFIQYDVDGNIDRNYGQNGILEETSIGYMTNTADGNILFYNSLRIEKVDYNNIPITSFGDNGIHSFPIQSDYFVKSYPNRLSYLELGDSPTKFYDLDADGNLNSNFNSSGSVSLDTNNGSLEFFDGFDLIDNKFYFSGYTTDEKPFLSCYDDNGNLVTLNNENAYVESNIEIGGFNGVFDKAGFLFTYGYEYDETNDAANFIIAKYETDETTLSTVDFSKETIKVYKADNILELRASQQINSINIFDFSGKKLRTSKLNKINTSNLSKGIYIVKLNLKNNKNYAIKLVI